MKIYIEDVIIINFTLYLSIIIIISNLYITKRNNLKLIASCFIGSILSGINVFISNYLITILYQSVITLFIITYSFKNLSVKKIVQCFILFIIISNIYTGILSRFSIFSGNQGLIINSPLSFAIAIFIILISSYIISIALNLIMRLKKRNTNMYDIILIYKDKKITTKAYLDTGNNLIHQTKPISFICFQLFNKLTGISLEQYITKSYSLKDYEKIKINTLTGGSDLLSFTADKIIVKNNHSEEVIDNPRLALTMKLSNTSYEVILNNNYYN